MQYFSANPGEQLSIDLPAQQCRAAGGDVYGFEIDAFRKQCLVEGLDRVALTLQYSDDIRAYEARRRQQAPWLFA